jgi:hypothetical protein
MPKAKRDKARRKESQVSDLVNIAGGLSQQEAHLLRGRLQADGIFAVVADENVSRALWLVAVGARVMVLKEDAAKALKIKRECEQA